MKIVREEATYDPEYYYRNRIPGKFDKWLDYDFGGIRTYAIPFDDNPDNWYMYEEAWNFVGKQPNGKYAFRCSSSYDKSQIGRVLYFDKFSDVSKHVALPGRSY